MDVTARRVPVLIPELDTTGFRDPRRLVRQVKEFCERRDRPPRASGFDHFRPRAA